MKIEIEEFILQVKDEFFCYDIDNIEALFNNWEKEFKNWLKKSNSKNGILRLNNNIYIKIRDEDEIFEVVNSYIDIINDKKNINEYWNKF